MSSEMSMEVEEPLLPMLPESVTPTPDGDQPESVNPSPANLARPVAVAQGSHKDFSLSSTQLFFDLKENGLDLEPFSKSTKMVSTEDDFEKIDAESLFVTAAIKESQRSRTENNAPTFSTSDDARVDFFFHVMEQTNPAMTVQLLQKSWDVDPLDTLKLVGSLRDIKDGKGIRQQYQHCLYWMYVNHPTTLYNNLPHLLKFGYWKDALHMLMVIIFDGFVHPYFAFDDGNKTQKTAFILKRRRGTKRKKGRSTGRQSDSEKRLYNTKIAEYYKMVTPNSELETDETLGTIPKNDMDAARFRYAREMFVNCTKYRIFHVRIAQIFAQQLAEDLTLFNSSEDRKKKDISLAVKWAPSLEGHFDRYTLISTTIALELARISKLDFLSKSIPTVAYLARKFYKKNVYVPLRAHLCIPETFMSNSDWGKVNYNRVAARCMRKNKEHFIKHDNERLTKFLTKDTTKVAGATLKPIELIRDAMGITEKTGEAERIILEKQWKSLVGDIKKKGSLLSGAIAICDVSGSMEGDPMIAALGLTLLTMELTSPPWNKICITFHDNPTVFELTICDNLINFCYIFHS